MPRGAKGVVVIRENAIEGSRWLLCVIASLLAGAAFAQPPLDPLEGLETVEAEGWHQRRVAMLETLLQFEYGHTPPLPERIEVEPLAEREEAYGVCRRVMLHFGPEAAPLAMEAAVWLPAGAEGPVPCVLAVEPVWWEHFVSTGIAPKLLKAGYAFAGFNHNALASYEDPEIRAALDAYPEYDWGTVAVAAWGLGVTMHWLAALPEIDAGHVAVWGHSRRGKSAALAGAMDERFAAVIPHMSGMGGTALYRVRGEGAQRIRQLLERYWLHPRVFQFHGREEELPFDQHWLHALIAPRPLYVHVGRDDAWGNPKGERAAYDWALPVYEAMGARDKLGIYMGGYGHHDPNSRAGMDSWDTLIDFLDWQFRGEPPERTFRP